MFYYLILLFLQPDWYPKYIRMKGNAYKLMQNKSQD